jgi:hypothetical protein
MGSENEKNRSQTFFIIRRKLYNNLTHNLNKNKRKTIKCNSFILRYNFRLGKCSSPLFSGLLMSSHYSSPFHLICRGFSAIMQTDRVPSLCRQDFLNVIIRRYRIDELFRAHALLAARYATLRLVTCAQITLSLPFKWRYYSVLLFKIQSFRHHIYYLHVSLRSWIFQQRPR